MDTMKKILIVDDEPDLSEMIGFQFEARGFDVQTAKDGVEALAKVHEFKPNLIILDMNMPRMGGIEFYGKICDSNNRPMYPVLVLTARANIQDLFKDFMIEGFMIKPFDIDRLIHDAEAIIKIRSRKGSVVRPSGGLKICVVDNQPKSLEMVTGAFLNADFTVIPAQNGAKAVEKMMEDVPDVALVSLGLADIAGDVLINRLSQMAKTMDVKYVLYTARSEKHDPRVISRIASKTGIFTFVEYDKISDLIDQVNLVLQDELPK